ncbi:MAG: hypothetical protein UT34_C0001G0461 [candidate division WS6 bacterium GW2011_GWF2_39_15]|uniref:Uncharacterized protein n=1 Tax=candidate division WS6 bacterium GW2011_GWF2_39_15 TaxID=1619100 RepID=A0A0G0N0Q2_9BACT|nr:MAG: hypothetical protein UT34_C0001G0461 [candidate division WS6 bacterium GW2011_GWF2_39_15]
MLFKYKQSNKKCQIEKRVGIGTAPTDPDFLIQNIKKSKCKLMHPIPFSEGPVNGETTTKPWEKRIDVSKSFPFAQRCLPYQTKGKIFDIHTSF